MDKIKGRNVEDMCNDFLNLKDNFKWFMVDYFGEEVFSNMIKLAEEKSPSIIPMLNDIWYLLPDSKFNIRENPKGWSEFLQVIEP